MKRAFTIIELVIVIAVIAIISAVLLPTITNSFQNSKDNIIDIYNGSTVKVLNADTGELLYEGDKTGYDLTGYTLVDVIYANNTVIMYVKYIN